MRTTPCRRTRGDGNCFFRSFFFGYLEHLLLLGDGAERARAVQRLEGLKKPMVEVGGYDEIGAWVGGWVGGWVGLEGGCVDGGRLPACWAQKLLARLAGLAISRPIGLHPKDPLHSALLGLLLLMPACLPACSAVLETPLEMVLSMLRGVGAPLDPLTIEGLEANIRDDDIRRVAGWWVSTGLFGCASSVL